MISSVGRICGHCKGFLSWESFNVNKNGLNGRKSICRVCTQIASNKLLKSRKENAPEFLKLRNRKKGLKSNYGMSLDCYHSMAVLQENKCAICNKEPDKPLFVDHCHKTGKIRDLLCQHCNTLLGMSFEDEKILMSAARYLDKHKI